MTTWFNDYHIHVYLLFLFNPWNQAQLQLEAISSQTIK